MAARNKMAGLVEVLRTIHAVSGRIELCVSRSLMNVPLAPGYMLQAWANDLGVEREAKQYWLQLSTKLLLIEDSLPEGWAAECTIDDEPSCAALMCYLGQSLLVSFIERDRWDLNFLGCKLVDMDESGNIVSSTFAAPHASTPSHVETHGEYISSQTPVPVDGRDLWQNRKAYYPHLDFCARVERQVSDLGARDPSFSQILKKLSELDQYFACTGPFVPSGILNCSPESQVTLQRYDSEHTFECPTGERLLFSWHVRFTPGAGRIYFVPSDGETRKATVGHIGEKLPSVTY